MKKLLMTIVLMPVMAMALELSPSYSTEAVSKYKEKADSGDAEAQFLYARALVNGDGTKKNATNAFDYAKRSADQGYELSYRMVGMGHEFGWGGSSNVAEAAVWYGKFHAWAKPAAEKGDAWAQYQLGLCLEYGNGVAKDAKEAVKWYRKAAERESAPAQLRLGSCYENGIGIEKNFSEAMKWYRKAAEQGDVGAQCELALCCSDWNRNGMGRERSREEGLKWYRRAADQGDVWAQTILGNCYKWGQGVEKSQNEAVKWYRKAADQGYHEAQCILGLYYMYGVGVEVNQAESVKWYRKAAEQDYFLGQSALGLCYANGWGVATNQVEAVKWCLKAAAHAWGAAQYQLVVCYANGDGVERDIKEAVKWYCKFAKNPRRPSDDPEKADEAYSGGLKCPMRTKAERLAKLQKTYDALAALGEEIKGLPSDVRAKYEKDLRDAKFRLDRARKRGLKGKSLVTDTVGSGIGAFAQKLLECDFLVNEQFKQNAKMYLCFLPVSRSLSWSMFDGAGKGGGMSRIAKIYAEVLKNDPDIEIIYFANDRSDEDALEWAKKRDVGFPVVAPDGGNPLRPCEPYSPRLSIVNADGAVLEDISIRGINPILEERLRELKVGAASELAQILQPPRQRLGGLRRPGQPTNNVLQKVTGSSADVASCVFDKSAQGKIMVANKLQGCDFLLNKDFKKNAKFYLCLFSASWCPPCRAEMPRIAKTYAETLKDDPDIELIHFSRDQNDEKALAWAKEHDVKFPVVKPKGGNPLDLHSRGIPHLFIVKADGTLLEEGHPMRIFNEEKFREIKGDNPAVSVKQQTENGSVATAENKDAVDGYTWSYRVNNGEATIVANVEGHPSCAVAPKPTGHFEIPSTIDGAKVTHIGNSAFYYCDGLESVTIPDGVTSIGNSAFQYCRRLSSVTIPNSVKSIGGGAFYQCWSLRSLAIPSGVTDIGDGAFMYCNRMQKFEIDPSNKNYKSVNGLLLTKDGSRLIAGVNGEVVIPSGVKSIVDFAFLERRMLTSVTIPEGVTSIGRWAFFGCSEIGRVDSGLSEITLPASVTSIGERAFGHCSGLKRFVVRSANKNFRSENGLLLSKDGKLLIAGINGEIDIPNGVTSIEKYAFDSCRGLTKLTIPANVESVGTCAFSCCANLTSVMISSSVTNIGQSAFHGCSSLSSVTMCGERPNSLDNLFGKCKNLKSIHVPANCKSWAGMKEWQGIPLVFDAESK